MYCSTFASCGPQPLALARTSRLPVALALGGGWALPHLAVLLSACAKYMRANTQTHALAPGFVWPLGCIASRRTHARLASRVFSFSLKHKHICEQPVIQPPQQLHSRHSSCHVRGRLCWARRSWGTGPGTASSTPAQKALQLQRSSAPQTRLTRRPRATTAASVMALAQSQSQLRDSCVA